MGKTSIEWTEESVNPLRARNRATGKVGHYCEKIAPGCKNCYSSALQPRFGLFPFLHENREKVDLFLDEEVLRKVLTKRKPTTYFWCSMTDLFLEHYPDEWIDRCFATMALRSQDTHIVLTKRGKRMREYFCGRKPGSLGHEPRIVYWMEKLCSGCEYLFDGIPDFPLPNVILGVSGSTQADIDALVPELLQTPAACRLLSLEPQVEDVDLTRVDYRTQLRDSLEGFARWDARKNGRDEESAASEARATVPEHLEDPVDAPVLNVLTGEWFDGWDSGTDGQKLDWVISGTESGTNPRPWDANWFRRTRDQCVAAGVPWFLKQFTIKGQKVGTPELDGKRWTQMPEVAARSRA